MSSINKVILIGNLGADPEMRYLPNGDAACSLRLATSSQWKDKTSGDTREATEWHRVVLFRRLAEVANDYLKKGAPVYLEGRIRTRRWQDKDGKEHFTTEIEATEMKMLGSSLSDTLPKSGTKTEPVPQTIANRTSTDRFGDVPF